MHNRERDRFAPDELSVVLSHYAYALGVIESITEFPRGSRRSPKIGIVCQGGKFLLKRRSPARSLAGRIAFSHEVQSHLVEAGFPLPRLVYPVDCATTVLKIGERYYELFEFVAGQAYRALPSETKDAGVILGHFHRLTRAFTTDQKGPRGDYHNMEAVRNGLESIPSSISAHDSVMGREAELLGIVQTLYESYERAATVVNEVGAIDHSHQITHSDWHPGNMLFRNDKVAAVIDYDSVRMASRVLDIANGVLQFSIVSGGRPASWPDHFDDERMRIFLDGYVEICDLSAEESRCLVHLMIEALIAECVLPIAATGSFGRWQGFGFMKMVRRKVLWLEENLERLSGVLTG